MERSTRTRASRPSSLQRLRPCRQRRVLRRRRQRLQAKRRPPRARTASPSAGQTPAANKAEDTKKDEAYWRKRLQTARDARSRAESFAEALQSRINALSNDFVNRDDPAQRNVIAGDRQKALAELDRVKKEIQQYTKDVADTQEEARRAGVPAGWVR